MKIGLYVPTRGRPDKLSRCIDSAYATASQPEKVEVIAYRDADDPSYDGAEFRCTFVTGPRTMLSKCWNACYSVGDADIVMHCGDDLVFRSEGWDDMVRNAFAAIEDRIAFVYGRDGAHDEALGTHGFLSREWVEAVGYMVPPLFSHDYNDTWLHEVGRRIGRAVYLPDLFTEHMHYFWGKAERDQTYADHEAAGDRDGVHWIWAETEHLRIRDAERLTAAIAAAAGQ